MSHVVKWALWVVGIISFLGTAYGSVDTVKRMVKDMLRGTRFVLRAEPGWRERATLTVILTFLVLVVLPSARRKDNWPDDLDLAAFPPHRPATCET